MRCKIYIVSCDNDTVFKTFINKIKTIIPGIVSKDYKDIKYDILKPNISTYFSKYNDADVKAISKAAESLNKYNNCMFNFIQKLIKSNDIKGVFLFLRVTDLYEMNRLKRKLKRPNYKTVRIDTTTKMSKLLHDKYHKYKFDSRVSYVSDNLLISQCKQFIRQHMGTLNQIRN